MNKSRPNSPDDPPRELSAELDGQPVRFVSRPGIPAWDRVTPAEALLAAQVQAAPAARLLLLGCGHGALGVSLSRKLPQGEACWLDTSILAVELADQSRQANGLARVQVLPEISVLPGQAGAFDLAVIVLPKGRKLARRWLAEAWGALSPGGALYLAGANGEGIQPVARDAAVLFGPGAVLGYKKGSRLLRFMRPPTLPAEPPAWLDEPGIAPGTWQEFELDTPQGSLRLRSLPGVFASGQLDGGTRLLLEHLEVPAGARVLDLGCGYGLIGLLAARAGVRQADLVDASLLAVASARENLRLHGVANAEALPSDGLRAVEGRRYDLVLTNPPFHVGKEVEYGVTQGFIRQAWQALEPGGHMLLVANRFIPYERVMQPVFTGVERVAETGKFHLLRGVKG
ncbi:MAG TPA: class I SAM-dependent methyltransferase [Anaerolineales bacterium]